ncbi:MAG: hypothetical protein ABIP71_11980, partial [Verrucomicrobiota bacterium]
LIRLVFAAAVGSLLWAGCASPRTTYYQNTSAGLAPVDLMTQTADTHPEWRVGIKNSIGTYPADSAIDEAAGFQR